jgi:hypothetical protein
VSSDGTRKRRAAARPGSPSEDDRLSEAALVNYIQAHFTSVWSLDLLVLLAQDRNRIWSSADLVREMRSSALCIANAVNDLKNIQLIEEAAPGRYRLAPRPPKFAARVAAIQNIYAAKPAVVLRTIARASRERK